MMARGFETRTSSHGSHETLGITIPTPWGSLLEKLVLATRYLLHYSGGPSFMTAFLCASLLSQLPLSLWYLLCSLSFRNGLNCEQSASDSLNLCQAWGVKHHN